MHLKHLGIDSVELGLVDDPVPEKGVDAVFEICGNLDGASAVGGNIILLVVSNDSAGAVLVEWQVCQLVLLELGQRGVLTLVEIEAGVDGGIGVIVHTDRWAGYAVSIWLSSPATAATTWSQMQNTHGPCSTKQCDAAVSCNPCSNNYVRIEKSCSTASTCGARHCHMRRLTGGLALHAAVDCMKSGNSSDGANATTSAAVGCPVWMEKGPTICSAERNHA